MKWTPEEETLLKENFEKPYNELMLLFPERTKKSIIHRINKLGLPREKKEQNYINIDEIYNTYNKDELVIYKSAKETTKDIICLKKSNIYVESDCHIVISHHKDKDGYAEMRFDNKRGKIRIHRFIFETFKEKIKDGNVIRHMCNNPSCCNPEHLKQGTYQDNSNDMIAAGRTLYQKGSKNHASKLTEEEVYNIKKLYKDGMRVKDIVKKFGYKRTTVNNIVYEYQWKHVKVN